MSTVATPSGTRAAEPASRRSAEERAKRDAFRRRLPLLPALIFTIALTQLPFLITIWYSLRSWNLLNEDSDRFVGLRNYLAIFTDSTFRGAALNSILYTLACVLFALILGMIFALLLDRAFLGRGLARTLLITPFLIMPVASAMLWSVSMFNPSYGLVNWMIGLVGIDPVDWTSQMPRISVIVALVWQWTPFMMLILLAGLQSQPGDVLEAARIDRASGWQIFRHITLPHLRRYIELSVLLGSVYVVQTFDAIYTITQGGPGSATTNLPYEIYLTMFRKFEYGEAAAAGVVVVVGTIIVATFALRTISSLFSEEEMAR